MRKSKFIFLLCLSLGMLSISCRDIENEKDLNSQEDGTREVNTTELEGVDRRETSDTTDAVQQLEQNRDGVYRENDVHTERERKNENK